MSKIIARPAQPRDRDEILAISAQVWDGRDYIPRALDKWYADKSGEFTVAEVSGRVVGFSKLTLLIPGHGWLEGARVDKMWRGRGVASLLARHHIALAQSLGLHSLRYATGSDNQASRALAVSQGFVLIGQFFRFEAEPTAAKSNLAVSGSLPPRTAHGLVPVGWTFYPWLDELIARWHSQGNCRYYGRAGAMVHEKRPGRLTISLLWGDPGDAVGLLRGISQQTGNITDISFVSDSKFYQTALTEAGFQVSDIEVVVYAYPLRA